MSSFQVGDSSYDFAVARLTTTGALDTSFDTDGKQTIDFGGANDLASSVAVDSADRVLVAGYSYQGATGWDFAVARLLGDDVNTAPVAVTDDFTTTEDQSVSGNLLSNDSDVDLGDTLRVVEVNSNVGDVGQSVNTEHGTVVVLANGDFIYTPGADCEATSDSFSYTISDGNGGTATALVTITITPDMVLRKGNE